MIDAHVYCLPSRLSSPDIYLPENERCIQKAIHQHPEGPYALGLASPTSILDSMDQADIARSVLVSFPWANPELCRENNDFILELAARQDRFMAICSVQPNDTQFIQEAARVLQAGALGIKINPVWQSFFLADKKIEDLAALIIEHGGFLMLHVDQPYKHSPASPAHLADLASRHPKLKILAAHLGGLLGISALHPPVAKKLRNVWYDTAVSSTLEMVRLYCQTGMKEKIVFGSDFPFNHSHSQKQVVDDLRRLELDTDVLKGIFQNNFFSLTGHPPEKELSA
jgi:uncharacterized protein